MNGSLRTLVSFEFRRTVTKRGFWIATLSVSILYTLMLAFVQASHSTAATDPSRQMRFEYIDESNLLDSRIAEGLGGNLTTDEDAAVVAVREGRLDAFIHYPADLSRDPIRVQGRDLGFFANQEYNALARSLLLQSAAVQIQSHQLSAALVHPPDTRTVTYRDGQQIRSLETALPALVFFVVFFMLISVLANHALNCVVEEKENRVAEMLLLSIRPSVFILGKITAILAVGALQIAMFALPVAIAYTALRSRLGLPDLAPLASDLQLCVLGTLLVLTGFVLVMVLLVALSAAIRTARDGAPYYSALVVTVFSPLYAVSTIISDPNSLLTQILLFCPPTAPMTSLLMNAFDTLKTGQAVVVIVELTLAAAVGGFSAVHLFRSRALGHPRTSRRSRRNPAPLSP